MSTGCEEFFVLLRRLLREDEAEAMLVTAAEDPVTSGWSRPEIGGRGELPTALVCERNASQISL